MEKSFLFKFLKCQKFSKHVKNNKKPINSFSVTTQTAIESSRNTKKLGKKKNMKDSNLT